MTEQPPPLPPGFPIPPPPPPPDIDLDDENEVTEEELSEKIQIGSEIPPPPPGFEPVEESIIDNELKTPLPVQGLPDIDAEETSIEDSLMALERSAQELEDWDESEDIEDSLNAISSPDTESQPIQSSSLRPALEVDSIPGDKLHATLSEIETSTVNPDGSIRNQSVSYTHLTLPTRLPV